jgi:hypothetical protein
MLLTLHVQIHIQLVALAVPIVDQLSAVAASAAIAIAFAPPVRVVSLTGLLPALAESCTHIAAAVRLASNEH